MCNKLRFIVLQTGAMRHYLVPAALARVGMLEQFYTDTCGNVGIFNLLNCFYPDSLQPSIVKRLFGRRIPDEIKELTTTLNFAEVLKFLALPMVKYKTSTLSSHLMIEALRKKIIGKDFLEANAIYTWHNSDVDLAKRAKDKGLFVVHDQYINADVGYILDEEKKRYPGIESQMNPQKLKEGKSRDFQKWEISDLIIAPSEFVRDSIVRAGGDVNKITVLPFGLNSDWLGTVPNPVPGRVLSVGSVGLRKGHHYLAKATRILKDRKVPSEVRVVGSLNRQILAHPEFHGPNYIGKIPRSEIKSEFLKADIFVLPTLSDSFAIAHLEAMACGLPVITTPNCGSLVRDGKDGFIVPIRDPRTLADRIQLLLQDRSLRKQMSSNARARASDYTWETYGERLIDSLKVLTNR